MSDYNYDIEGENRLLRADIGFLRQIRQESGIGEFAIWGMYKDLTSPISQQNLTTDFNAMLVKVALIRGGETPSVAKKLADRFCTEDPLAGLGMCLNLISLALRIPIDDEDPAPDADDEGKSETK